MPLKSENRPQAYIFSKALSEGLIYTEGNGRDICVSKSIGLDYSRKKIYVSNLHQGFTETRHGDQGLFKTQPCEYFGYMDRGNSSQE